MNLTVNGEKRSVNAKEMTVTGLLGKEQVKMPEMVSVELNGRTVQVRVWRLAVGRVFCGCDAGFSACMKLGFPKNRIRGAGCAVESYSKTRCYWLRGTIVTPVLRGIVFEAMRRPGG